jgi:hypothetical protein
MRTSIGLELLLGSLLVALPARAQLDPFTWMLQGSPFGSGTQSPGTLHIVGSDNDFNCPSGTDVWFETVTPVSGTVTAFFTWDNQDHGIGFWKVDAPFWRVGTATTFVDSGLGFGSEYVDFAKSVSFHAEAGQELAFGVWSLDCTLGPGVLDVSAFSFEPDTWSDLGSGLAGSAGTPSLVGIGPLQPGTSWTFSLVDCAPLAPAFLVLGATPLLAPFKGGVLVPEPASLAALTTSPSGRIILTGTWPAGVPAGLQLVLQYWIADPTGPAGFAASNGLIALVP